MLRSLAAAFSMYSKIPMPGGEWKDDEIRYVMAFFPLVGIVIGAVSYPCCTLLASLGFSPFFISAILVQLPLIITGGIHLDGFMDTQDALSSYRSKEEKLEIMSDPHIGAFAVIHAIVLTVIYLASAYEVISVGIKENLLLWCLGFYFARIVTAISTVTLKCAKKEGTLFTFSNVAQKKTTLTLLMIQLLAASFGIAFISYAKAAAVFITTLLLFALYRGITSRNFGGVTGDTSGWFLCTLECAYAILLAAWDHIIL